PGRPGEPAVTQAAGGDGYPPGEPGPPAHQPLVARPGMGSDARIVERGAAGHRSHMAILARVGNVPARGASGKFARIGESSHNGVTTRGESLMTIARIVAGRDPTIIQCSPQETVREASRLRAD